ncbi:MAG TPA: cyclopropane-fatty-acyl-phospholipid synthase family protein [Aeromicrobium sp.]|nr:cyclopropane-fatty-acyl-phospholipid synthase family protein [Aeromicrobium sp.]
MTVNCQDFANETSLPVASQTTWTSGLRVAVAKRILKSAINHVGANVYLADGTKFYPDSTRSHQGPSCVLQNPDGFLTRLAQSPKMAIGEGYTAGDWRPGNGQDLADFLTPFAEKLTTLIPSWVLRFRRLVDQRIPINQLGSIAHTRDNISAHYDLSNEMFAGFLDPSLSYSSAKFDPELPLAKQDFQEAQLRKVNDALDLARVGSGDEILEIGTGWGTLAIEAARRGARVTTVTLSVEQAELARERINSAGFGSQVDVLVQDYRKVEGKFDAVVSIEMIEAVGERYWPEYFGALSKLLRPGGAVSLQAILMSHDRYRATRNSYGWIQKHIFPGGLIPSAVAITENARNAGLAVTHSEEFGSDYAETLRRWRSAFIDAWPTIKSNEFDEQFRRTWEFYLAYCEAGFRTGYLSVAQIRLETVQSENQ